MIISSKVSADNLGEIDAMEDEFSSRVREHFEVMTHGVKQFEEMLASRLECTVSEASVILNKDTWSFRTSIEVALAMGMEVNMELVNDK